MYLPKSKDEFVGQYWLKNDLIDICVEYGLPKNGSKEELTLNICNYLEKKQIVYFKKDISKRNADYEISLINTIDSNYKNDENHREFFKSVIGISFKYNVQFMNWMNDNKGLKTYNEAVLQWRKIDLEIKNGKKI